MDNTMKCKFIVVDDKRTKYQYEFENGIIRSIMPKLIAILFPGVFRKPGEKRMNQLKELI